MPGPDDLARGSLRGLAGDGGTTIANAWHVNVFQGMPQPVAQSAYLEQVRRIAPRDPPGLQDREAELAELVWFCSAPDAAPYVWWRAGPWAGKSALLSSFVLRPPSGVAEKASIVSFFITARLAAQDTREAFTEVLLQQLAALLGQPLPTVLSEATREPYLLRLMSQAAAACRQAGRRLVLVVDGLDEERGVPRPGARSIAGLLPADPPAGMRVIVAGRPDPPVPDDVPDWHPLRDPAIIRPLTPSPHAQDLQRLASEELRALLRGSRAERDMLGLLAAARGGLTTWDLADLSGIPRWEAEDILHTVTGRTLQSRPSLLDSASRPEVYLLGHEELQAAAVSYLGDRIIGYRDRLHKWAGRYRARKWPPDTPEYLLSGYFRLLEDLGDLSRMTECGRDQARHDRMLSLSGGDVAGTAEARAALDRIVAGEDPDLASALALACHRDRLAARNISIPASLPAVWVIIGQAKRAEAAASSLASPNRRAQVLAELAEALAQEGLRDQALAIAERAEEAAALIGEPNDRAAILAAVSASLASPVLRELSVALAGRAQAAAGQANSPAARATALAAVAHTLQRAGRLDQALVAAEQAEAAARAVPIAPRRDQSLCLAAGALAEARQPERAVEVAMSMAGLAPDSVAQALMAVADALARTRQFEEAMAVVRSIPGLDWQAVGLARLAAALAVNGQHDRAADFAGQAETAAESISHPIRRVQALGPAAWALAQAGRHEQSAAVSTRAVETAQPVSVTAWRAVTLGEAAGVLARAGKHAEAAVILREAEAGARALINPGQRAEALTKIALAQAEAGQHVQAAAMAQQAGEAASSDIDHYRQALSVAEIARTLAQAGHDDQALAIAELAGATAQEIPLPDQKAMALAQVAEALAHAGQHGLALALAEQAKAIASPLDAEQGVKILLQVARALAQAEQPQRAADVAGEAITAARMIPVAPWQAHLLALAAVVLARAGQHAKANDVATKATGMARPGLIMYTSRHTTALRECAAALAQLGRHEEAIQAVSLIPDPRQQAQGLARVAGALVRAAHHEQAVNAAGAIQDIAWRAIALVDVAEVLAGTELRASTLDAARQAEAGVRSIPDPAEQSLGLARIARALARAGHQEQAVDTAGRAEAAVRSIPDPARQEESLGYIAEALALAGQHKQAATVAETIAGAAWRGYALVALAENLARAGRSEWAAAAARQSEAAIRLISDPELQAQAIERVTSVLAQVGDAETARKAAARSCAIGPWTTAAKAVLQLSPAASTELIRALGN